MPQNPKHALRRLKEGNLRFARDAAVRPSTPVAQRQALADLQEPFAHVLTCADSRVSPEIVFDQGLGDLFVTRVAGNVIDELVIGTIELSVNALDIPLIVVLGHSGCKAVAAALGDQNTGRAGHIRALLQPAIDRARGMSGELQGNVILENVLGQRDFLRQCEPVVAPRWRQGGLLVVGAVYDLFSGVVRWVE